MKKLLIVLVLIFVVCGCTVVRENPKVELLSGKVNVQINVADYGSIKLELDADTAPITVTNFVNLVQEGFYNGLTFHRVIKDFMIQGGDPDHDGTGGSGKTIKGEFKNNGIENNISHVRGVISMARSNQNDSASSQFFIVHQDSPHLDGDYAAFGHVTEGMDVVDKIANADLNFVNDDGLVDFTSQPIITSILVLN